MTSQKERLLLEISDLLKQIDNANEQISLHRKTHSHLPVMYGQYEQLRNEYLNQLASLLKNFDVTVKIPRTDRAA